MYVKLQYIYIVYLQNHLIFICVYVCFLYSIMNLTLAKTEPLTRFLPLILDKLIGLMVKPITVGSMALNISQTVFEAVATIVKNITVKTLYLVFCFS